MPMTAIQCHQCAQAFQVEGMGDFLCPHCGAANRVGAMIPVSQYSSWETGWTSRPFSAFWETFIQILTDPITFFRTLQVSPRFGPIITYSIICQTLGFVGSMIFQWVLVLFLPFFPIFAFIGLIISTAIHHAILWMLGGAKKGFEGTFHALSYSSTAQVAMVIPIFGGFITFIWQTILLVIGLKEIHGISYGKSILCVLIPMVFCCSLGLLAMGALVFVLFFTPALSQDSEIFQKGLEWLRQWGLTSAGLI